MPRSAASTGRNPAHQHLPCVSPAAGSYFLTALLAASSLLTMPFCLKPSRLCPAPGCSTSKHHSGGAEEQQVAGQCQGAEASAGGSLHSFPPHPTAWPYQPCGFANIMELPGALVSSPIKRGWQSLPLQLLLKPMQGCRELQREDGKGQ